MNKRGFPFIRAWVKSPEKDNSQMYHNVEHMANLHDYMDNPWWTFMAEIGKRDVFNNPMFREDIVDALYVPRNHRIRGIIRYDADNLQYYVASLIHNSDGTVSRVSIPFISLEDIRVVGNTFQNPEMLKEIKA